MMKNRYFISFLFLVCTLNSEQSLDFLAAKYNTDKRSGEHNYTQIYEHYFSKIRNQNLTILEIGFGAGNSAHMWEEYFPNAELHFMEINPDAFKLNKIPFSTRCHFHLMDQSNIDQINAFKKIVNKKFDIIIDDGSHICSHQIISFKTLFPLLKKGGCYVIEDLHTSYWHMYEGKGNIGSPQASENSAICYFMNLVHDINYVSSYTGYGDRNRNSAQLLNNLEYFQRHLHSIHFHPSMCFIYKNDLDELEK